ncbi:MAG: hypothetical protein K0S46_1860 [Moraxellaceae bacterium]|nr:hypothetical protein [Moraxellaceae bacterium]
MTASMPHVWRFFRAGGFDQVQLNSPADLAALRTLDQKLWAALACPVKDLEFDRKTLEYIDSDGDGRIRAPELLDAVDWALARLADPATLFRDEPLAVSAFRDDDTGRRLTSAARRLLTLVDRADGQTLSVADLQDLQKLFPPAQPNGDGIVPAALTEDERLKAVIADIIACMGAEKDRSGEDGVSETSVNEFFAQAGHAYAWYQKGQDTALQPFGDDTAAAIAALLALREKINDYFHRVALADFDPRAGVLMNGEEGELVRLAALNLADVTQTASLPLATIGHGEQLPLGKGVNPAWRAAIDALRERVVLPLLGEREALTLADWRAINDKCAPHLAWQAEKPALVVLEKLEPKRLAWMVEGDSREQLLALIARDRTVSEEADNLIDLDRLLRYQQHLLPLLNNFISFRDFYTQREKAVFQSGRLFIDGKSCDLVVKVGSIDEHAKMAAASGSFLLYCECQRRTVAAGAEREKMNIVAAVTAGEEGNLMVGRNGVFYDREGRDWDARVVRMTQNAISVREAFWVPYRRIARMISEQIQKFAANSDQSATTSAMGGVTATAQQATAVPVASVPAAVAPAPKAPFDIAKFAGVFAAIGLAIGAIGTALAAVVGGFLALKWWQMPMAIGGGMLLLSGPSMLLAWFKLRRRNLAPILDANGWAVNTQARLSIGFGGALTQVAALPQGSERSLRDPYAGKRPLWPWLLLVLLAAAWFARDWLWLLLPQ